MKANKAIIRIIKTHTLALMSILLFQAFFYIIFDIFITIFVEELGQDVFAFPKRIVFASLGVILILCDVFFGCIKLLPLRKLLYATPAKCTIEDLLLIAHKDDGRRKYSIYPIVRSLQDDKLYLAYGTNAIAKFSTRVCYLNNQIVDFTVYSKNKSTINIGDTVYMYMLRELDVSVSVDKSKNIVKLNRKRIPFCHVNESCDIALFNDIIFFQGIIDIE